MADSSREQVLSLLAAANNHGDLAVKVSSLQQAKDVLLYTEPSMVAELLPYLVRLHSSPESLLRKSLIEVLEEIGLNAMDHASILMPTLLSSLKDSDPIVSRQSLVSGTKIFCNVIEELSLQFQQNGRIQRWLEELWTWMVRFKDVVIGIMLEVLEGDYVGLMLPAMKFLETYVMIFSSDTNESEKFSTEAITRSERAFNISWLVGGHPILDPIALTSEVNTCLAILFGFLRSAGSLRGSQTISIVNCLAMVARRRQLHYNTILSEFLDFDPHFEKQKGGHTASIQYSLRTSFLGFLRCTSPTVLESRTQLLRALRAMNAGDAADQVIRQVDKMRRNSERPVPVLRLNKDDQQPGQLHVPGESLRKRSMPVDDAELTHSHVFASKRICIGPYTDSAPPVQISDSVYSDNGVSPKVPSVNSHLTHVEQMIVMLCALIAEGERGAESLDILISQLHPDLLADIIITNMKHLPKKPPPLATPGGLSVTQESGFSSCLNQFEASIGSATSVQSPLRTVQIASSTSNAMDTSLSHTPSSVNLPADSKRDPRRVLQLSELRPIAMSTFTRQVVPLGAMPSLHLMDFCHCLDNRCHWKVDIAVGPNSSSTKLLRVKDERPNCKLDPRRINPRRVAVPNGVSSTPTLEETTNSLQAGTTQVEFDSSISWSKPLGVPVTTAVGNNSVPSICKTETKLKILESPIVSGIDHPVPEEELLVEEANETVPVPEVNTGVDISLPELDEESMAPKILDVSVTDEAHSPPILEANQLSPVASNTSVSEETCPDLPVVPEYVELTEEQQRSVRKLAVEKIIESHKQILGTGCSSQISMGLLARMVAQTDADDDMVGMIQNHIISDYEQQKGQELVMLVLYHLHTLTISEKRSSHSAVLYEKFLLGVANSLLSNLPSSDKSFSRLLGEVPFLPDSALKLLHNICYSGKQYRKDVSDRDHVTQGLGTIWSLILRRPLNRQACLDIALKCAVHSEDDIRTKAIRLVANKLYVLNYISESVEHFATSMLLSAVDQRVSDIEILHPRTTSEKGGEERGSKETSISGSQDSEPGTSENDFVKGAQSDSQSDTSMSFAQAQRLISLFFALCTKKPILLQLVFDNYARAPKAVKQAVHRHIPILMRALGSSYSELFHIISNPPEGSENLVMQVLRILSEGTTPTSDLIATIKHLYATKLKDATILIPMLSSLSKNEVLPIFPRLVDLPLDKFQRALAHILQGSAHTGPALTPAEVLVAIHDIIPEKDGLSLKKIMDACSACFEQRTVFTEQVLAKALNQMVDQTPPPLLFMRTVIQSIDAFPNLVDFVMELLSKLVNKQVWRLPKLWVGFLKCVSQTQPHSFQVLLKLPSQQLESALNKYGSLRSPLAAYAGQPSVKTSLNRSTLVLLGLANELHTQ